MKLLESSQINTFIVIEKLVAECAEHLNWPASKVVIFLIFLVLKFEMQQAPLRFAVSWKHSSYLKCSLIYRGYYTGARRYEFYFRVAKQYFTNERSEWVKYCFCHEKIKFISSSRRVMFFLLYRHADDGVFDDFPKISDHLPNISEDLPKLFRRPDERSRTFSEIFRKFPKMPEDCRRLPKTFEEDPKMFRWYTNEF